MFCLTNKGKLTILLIYLLYLTAHSFHKWADWDELEVNVEEPFGIIILGGLTIRNIYHNDGLEKIQNIIFRIIYDWFNQPILFTMSHYKYLTIALRWWFEKWCLCTVMIVVINHFLLRSVFRIDLTSGKMEYYNYCSDLLIEDGGFQKIWVYSGSYGYWRFGST